MRPESLLAAEQAEVPPALSLSGRALIEALSDAVIVTDQFTRIVLLNPSAQRLFGYTSEELLGARLDVILALGSDSWGDGLELHQTDAVTSSARHGAYASVRGRNKSGDECWVELSATSELPNNSGKVWLLRHLAVEASNGATRSSAVRQMEGTSVGIVRLNGRGEVTYLNDVWRRFVGDNGDQESTFVGLGGNYLEACDKSQHSWGPDIAAGIRALLAGSSDYFEIAYSCHSPSELRWLRLQARRPPDESRAVVLTHIDNTAQQFTEARSHIQSCVAHAFTERKSLVASCRRLAQIVCQELQWDYMGIWLPETERWELYCADSWLRPGLPRREAHEQMVKARLPPWRGLPGRVWGSRQAEWLPAAPGGDTNAMGQALPNAAIRGGFRSGFAFAVKYDDDVLAVVEVFSRRHQSPNAALLSLLENAGVQLAAAELRERAESRATSAQAEADAAREQLEAVLSCVPALVLAIDRDGALSFVNRALPDTLTSCDPRTSWKPYIPAVARERIENALQEVLESGEPQTLDGTINTKSGESTWFTHYLGPIRSGAQVTGVLLVSQDVTQTKRAQQELFSAQHMAALGTMAAGVAHEINTPIQFVGDSLDFLRDATSDTAALLRVLLKLRDTAAANPSPEELRSEIEATRVAEEQADLEYLVEHVPRAFDRCAEGLERVTTIVRSMKEFSHPASKQKAPTDLNRAIMTTLTVARNEYKYVADVVTDLGDLPMVNCHANDINQVVLNIIVNAAHAIGDVVDSTGDRGTITVRTSVDGEYAVIAIGDTGGGIPEEVRDKIFDPFFTTKEVGKGTGQGLALAWQSVRERHAGDLTFDTTIGQGTTFFIRLPIEGKKRPQE